MKHVWALSFLLATLLWAGSAAAGAFPVDRVMVDTGMDQLLIQLGDGVAHSAADSGVTDKDLLGKWQATAGTMFKLDHLNTGLSDALAQRPLSDDDQAALDRFFSSDLGKRLVAAEIASDKLDADQSDAAIDQGKQIVRTISARRTALYARYWTVASGPGRAITDGLLRTGVLAVFLARNLGHGDAAVDWTAIDNAADNVAAGAVSNLKDSVTWGNAYIYKDFTDDEMATYLDFLSSPAGQHLYAACADAIDQVISDEVTRFGATIAAAVNAVSI
jgi:hypothetical protein